MPQDPRQKTTGSGEGWRAEGETARTEGRAAPARMRGVIPVSVKQTLILLVVNVGLPPSPLMSLK